MNVILTCVRLIQRQNLSAAEKNPKESPELTKLKRDFRNRETSYQKYLEIMQDLVLHPEKTGNLKQYFQNREITHIALYGETAILKTIVPLLKEAGVTVDYVVENRKASAYSENLYPRSLEKYPETQMILIADVRMTEEIKKKLNRLTKIPYCSIAELFA